MSEQVLWENDKLGREAEGLFLLKYLNALYAEDSEDLSHESFVLNLNAPWGQGKTYFLKNIEMLIAQHKHPVLYFDAWTNDYSNSPLLSFISELQTALKPYSDKVPKGKALQKTFLKNGKKLLGSLAGLGTQILVKRFTGLTLEENKELIGFDSSVISEIETGAAGFASAAVDKIVENSLNEHQETKELIKSFKESLYEITQSLKDNADYSLPMYILVDELDRCRPTYAIELLETIKHVFSTSGVFFIVATHKEELAHSIRAVYGTGFDSFNYLKRFFNQEYTLSVTDTNDYSKFLFLRNRISSDKFIIPFDENKNKTDNLALMIFEKLTASFKLSLRDKEQLCIQLKSILLTLKDDKVHYIYLLVILIFNHMHGENIFPLIEKYIQGQYKDIKPFTIVTMKDTGQGYSSDDISIYTVIGFYYQNKDKDRGEINRIDRSRLPIWQESIYMEIMSNNQKGNFMTPLSKYQLLVQQAGHLS